MLKYSNIITVTIIIKEKILTCPPRTRPTKMLVYLQSKGDKGHEKETALGGRDNPDHPGSRRWADGGPSMSNP
jgi:hypothetical protein